MKQSRDLATGSRKRKHVDVEEDEDAIPDSPSESSSSAAPHPMDIVEPVEHMEVTVTPNHEAVSAVVPPTKRRRIVRTAAHVLVGGAMVYLGLGML